MKRERLQPISYPIKEEPIVLSKPLLDIMFSQEDPADIVALYVFYYYTAKWQQTDQIKATTNYTAAGLQWSRDRVRKVKNILRDLELIEDFQPKDELGQTIGHFIKINFVWSLNQGGIHPPGNPPSGYPPINALKTNMERGLKADTLEKKGKEERNIIPPPKELVEVYCVKRKNGVNPQIFIDFYESKGWFVGKNKMKDWQAAIRTWESKGESTKGISYNFNPNTKGKAAFIHDDGIRYDLRDDGYYYHCRSGERYIP